MSWTTNEVILNQRPTMASNDLFQAVCDELGHYFEQKGFKYAKSKTTLTFKDKELKLTIGFNSSRSNTPGSHVALEILPNFYSLELIKEGKSTIESKIAKGLILSHLVAFKYKNIEGNKKIVRQIYGDTLELDPRRDTDVVISHNNTCNIWGIDENKFSKIIMFIESKILPLIDTLKDEQKLLQFLEDKPEFLYSSLKGERVNSDFVPFCKYKFPQMDIDSILK